MSGFGAYAARLRAGAVLLACAVLAACTLDSEEEVRAQLDTWVTLADPVYFESGWSCTAAVYTVEDTRIRSFITRAKKVARGLQLVDEGRTVAFTIEGLSPTRVSEEVMTADLPKGIGVLNSGIAAQDCMEGTVPAAYLMALKDPQAILIFAPENKAMGVLDRRNMRVFYARGKG